MHSRTRWLVAVFLGVCLSTAGCSSESSSDVEASIEGGPAAEKAGTAEPGPPQKPRVAIQTSLGEITVELDPEHSPITVRNFLDYVNSGHYDQTVFHQAIEDYIVLGGGYSPKLTEKPTRPAIRNEADNGLPNKRGTIAMARQPDAIDSSASQFFLNVADNKELDHHGRTAEEYGYCVFGQIVEGIDVADQISKVEVHDTADFEMVPVKTVLIESVRQVR
jgi:cyclophilin family peptidyl-prolyl cis-trans isomerase